MNELTQGRFYSSLKRSNKKIKQERAIAIAEDAQLVFKRTVEDLQMDLKRKERSRNNMLDLSPANTQSLVLAQNFDSIDFVEKDLKLSREILEIELKLKIAESRYGFLFGEEVEEDQPED